MDFRQHRRYEVNIPVAYSGDEIGGKGAATNLSVGGCAVLGDCGVRVGSFVELVLHLPPPHTDLAVPLAVVRYCVGTKFGLDFLQMPAQLETRLRKYLKSL
jgi:hypothetical protein